MNETQTPENVAYELLKKSGLLSGNDKCPKCDYYPILDSFNYCPMCTHRFSKKWANDADVASIASEPVYMM